MNYKILILLSFAIISSKYTYANCRDISHSSQQPKIVNREDEIKSTELIWRNSSEMPLDAVKTIKTKFNKIDAANFSLIDLNGDSIDELIVNSESMSGSGGRVFMFLEKQNGKWKEIALFTGGFILNNRWTPKTYNRKYLTITQWARTGASETWQDLWSYKDKKYQIVSSQPVPLAVLYSKDFQKMILDLNWMCWDRWN